MLNGVPRYMGFNIYYDCRLNMVEVCCRYSLAITWPYCYLGTYVEDSGKYVRLTCKICC